MRPHPRRARTDATYPEAWGTDDKSGFVGNQADLCFQYEWQGTKLVNKRILCFQDQLDIPNRQLGTIILPPDPASIVNARPEPYPIDEVWPRMMEIETNVGGITNALPRYLERSTTGQDPSEMGRSLETSTINMYAPTS
jgi:hypothetical protein